MSREAAEVRAPSEPRKVLMSPELMEEWASRDPDGYRLTWDWGEPNADGCYEPTITTHADDRLGVLDRAWAACEAALPAGWVFSLLRMPDGSYRAETWPYRYPHRATDTRDGSDPTAALRRLIEFWGSLPTMDAAALRDKAR